MAESLLDLASKRRGVLESLAGGSGRKRDLVEELDVSRSTVDRAIAELTDRDLVHRSDGCYRATPLGRLALETVREATDTLATAEDARPLLNALPEGETIPPAVLREATVVHPPSPAPLSGLDDVVDDVRTAEEVRGITRTYTSEENAAVFRDRALDGSMTLDLVLDEEVLAYCERELFDPERVLAAEEMRLWAHPEPPFGLYLVSDDAGTTVYVVCYGPDHEYAGHVETASPEALAWADSVFEAVRSEGTPYESWRG